VSRGHKSVITDTKDMRKLNKLLNYIKIINNKKLLGYESRGTYERKN
jgi:hypothetical protein